MRLLPLALVLVLLAAGSSGCVRRPQVGLRNVQVSELDLPSGSLRLTLEVTNPNSFALDAERLSYALEVEGPEGGWVEFAQGSYETAVSIPPGESAILEVPVDFDLARLGGAPIALLRTGGVDYRLRGTVLLHTPIGTRSVPFKKQAVLGKE